MAVNIYWRQPTILLYRTETHLRIKTAQKELDVHKQTETKVPETLKQPQASVISTNQKRELHPDACVWVTGVHPSPGAFICVKHPVKSLFSFSFFPSLYSGVTLGEGVEMGNCPTVFFFMSFMKRHVSFSFISLIHFHMFFGFAIFLKFSDHLFYFTFYKDLPNLLLFISSSYRQSVVIYIYIYIYICIYI